jgi:HPt (histidine-containing phosphotransfer) domain-containing protein
VTLSGGTAEVARDLQAGTDESTRESPFLSPTETLTARTVSEVLREFDQRRDFDFLVDLIECLLADAQERLRAMRQATTVSRDILTLAKQGHALKGSAASMGLAEIMLLCGDLEHSARSGSVRDYACAVAKIDNGLRDIRGRIYPQKRSGPNNGSCVIRGCIST